MTTEWSLDELYKGFDDPAYGKDVAELTAQIDALATLLADAGRMQEKERTEKVLAAQSGIAQLFYQLSLYVELRQSVNTEDGTVMAENAKLMKLQAKIAPLEAAAGKLLAGIRDVDALAKESGLVREHTFYLKEKQKEAKHLLSDEVEEMAASMNMSGGAAWSKLQSYLTSTVKVDYQGKQITLSEVRNLAYSPEASVRKSAYEAEIAAYEKVEDAIAFSLNYIKNQVTMLSEKRGYASPLAMTLEQSRMKRETLDAMMAAIDEYLPKNVIKALDILADVAVFILAIVMITVGFSYATGIGAKGNYVSMPWLSKFWMYFPIPLAGVAMVVFELEAIYNHIKSIFVKEGTK